MYVYVDCIAGDVVYLSRKGNSVILFLSFIFLFFGPQNLIFKLKLIFRIITRVSVILKIITSICAVLVILYDSEMGSILITGI